MTATLTYSVSVLFLFLVAGGAFAQDGVSQADESLHVITPAESLQQYQDTISKLESEQGAYHPALRQALLALGLWHRDQGDNLQAVEAFEKALHIAKVNAGLHDPAQVEIVELLIDSYSQLQDWRGLDKNLNYLLWLSRRNYNNDDDRLVAIIERVARWYMQAYQLYSGGEAVSSLVKADDLYDEAARIIEKQYGQHAKQLINVLHATATINYQIASDVDDVFRMSHRDIRAAMIPNRRPTPYLNEVAVRAFYFEQSFYKGKHSLDLIINIYKDELPEATLDYAQALVYQGDFYLSLNRKWNAMRNYEKAYATLVEGKAGSEDIKTIFGAPRRVEPFAIPGREIAAVDESRYIDAMFDVPGNGWPKDIRIIATHPEDSTELRTRGRHAVSATRYRPRFEEGKPVSTAGVSLRYVFRK